MSLIAVLIPLLFMGDVVGRLFREFAITLAVTILVSAVVSLTLTPMMCARLLHHRTPEEQGRFYRASERAFEKVIEFYGRTLQWVLRHQPATLIVAAATLVATILLYVIIPKGFFPVQDTGLIMGVSEAAQSTSFSAMAGRQQALVDVVLRDPAVESLSSFIGVDGTNTTINSGRIQINLKPLEERKTRAGTPSAAPARAGQSRGDVVPSRSRTRFVETAQPHAVQRLRTPDAKVLAPGPGVAPSPVAPSCATGERPAERRLRPCRLPITIMSRLGITPQMLTTRRRRFSARLPTMFTQLTSTASSWRRRPASGAGPGDLSHVFLRSAQAVPLSVH